MRKDDTQRDLRDMLSVYLSQVNVTWGWIKGQTKRKKDYNLIQALYTCKHQSIPVCIPPHTELSSPSVSVPNHLPLATALCFYPAYNEIGWIKSWKPKGAILPSQSYFFLSFANSWKEWPQYTLHIFSYFNIAFLQWLISSEASKDKNNTYTVHHMLHISAYNKSCWCWSVKKKSYIVLGVLASWWKCPGTSRVGRSLAPGHMRSNCLLWKT